MKKRETQSLFCYVAIAYGLTWICWITALVLGYQELPFISMINWQFTSSRQMIAFIIFRLGVYGPLLASLVVSYLHFRKEGIRALWNSITKWKVEAKWYLYVVLFPVLLNLVVVSIGLILGIPLRDFFDGGIPVTLLLAFLIYQVLTSGLEEPGWRGFALDRLQSKYTAEQASWILGLIWAVWHYPYVISLYYETGFAATSFSLLGFTMAIIGQTFIITWFYNNTKSVLIAILLHASLNTSTTFILGNITISSPIMGTIPALVTWGAVFVLLKKYGGESLVTSRRIDS